MNDAALDTEYFRHLLEDRRAALQHAGRNQGADDVSLDQTRVGRLSRMDAMQDHEMSLDAARRRQVELKAIDLALTKLEDDEYGLCEDCDRDIAPGRLEIDPAARYCVACAGQRENPGRD